MIAESKFSRFWAFWFAVLILLSMSGCSTGVSHMVIAATETNIGVEIAQNPATSQPQAKLGYNRAELAIVPTNRSMDKDPGSSGNGARDAANVIMELKYTGIFDWRGSGIYQKLAVGDIAVQQPGAAYMFAKGTDGLDEDTAKTISEGITSIPERTSDVRTSTTSLARAYVKLAGSKKEFFDSAAKGEGYLDFQHFLMGKPAFPTLKQVKSVRENLMKDPAVKEEIEHLEGGK